MQVRRYIQSASITGLAALCLSNTAAAETVDIANTGPDSGQEVSITETNTSSTANTNTVVIKNKNVQVADTGDVVAKDNTSVSGPASGDAANASAQATAVAVSSKPAGGMGQGTVPTPPSATPGVPAVVPGASVPSSPVVPVGGRGGGVLGASTGGLGAGPETLPSVGASIPMDVSALRQLYQPQSEVPTKGLTKNNYGFSVGLIALAALLSLAGAGATIRTRLQQIRRA